MHDTEMCADESGCSQPIKCRGLCSRHYQSAVKRSDLPPSFRRYLRGRHGLGEEGPDGLRWCSACRTFVHVYSNNGVWTCGVQSNARHREITTGWTPERFDTLLIEQGNRCAICDGKPSSVGLVADHCHDSNQPRRLLCLACNTALGYFKDNPGLMRKAANYVEDHG